jgi:hypothetical protein
MYLKGLEQLDRLGLGRTHVNGNVIVQPRIRGTVTETVAIGNAATVGRFHKSP